MRGPGRLRAINDQKNFVIPFGFDFSSILKTPVGLVVGTAPSPGKGRAAGTIYTTQQDPHSYDFFFTKEQAKAMALVAKGIVDVQRDVLSMKKFSRHRKFKLNQEFLKILEIFSVWSDASGGFYFEENK